MPVENQFKEFEQALNDSEKEAIKKWLGIWYDSIRTFQKTGNSDKKIIQMEQNLTSALEKAVICQKTVYRGLSAGNWRPESIAYIRALIEGPVIIELSSHDSASVIEKVAREFTHTNINDEERNLSVLLKIKPKTARYLAPFQHKAMNEEEVVLLRGTKYKRIKALKQPDPKPDLEYWELEFEEIS